MAFMRASTPCTHFANGRFETVSALILHTFGMHNILLLCNAEYFGKGGFSLETPLFLQNYYYCLRPIYLFTPATPVRQLDGTNIISVSNKQC